MISVPEMLADAKLDKIGLGAHVLLRSFSTWSFIERAVVVVVLITDKDMFAAWTLARLNTVTGFRARIRRDAARLSHGRRRGPGGVPSLLPIIRGQEAGR
jgi:hypothetical protein